MKTIKIFTCMLALVLLTFACSKKDLDTVSTRQLATSYYNYDEHMDNLVNGAYSSLQLETSRWGNNPWLWGSCAASDDAWSGGANSADRPGYQYSNTHTMVSNEADMFNLWQTYFQGIDRCNLILTYVKPESPVKKNAIGQAQFLCGFYYFYLARMFGGLPLMSKVLSPNEQIPRSSFDDTYTFIENLLRKAVYSGMQERQVIRDANDSIISRNDPSNGLATKSSAQALLGKVFMYHACLVNNKAYYDSAAIYLGAVAADPGFILEKHFYRIFSPGHMHGVESIFEINFTQVNNNGQQGNPTSILCGPRCSVLQPIDDTINYGWGFNQPTSELKQLFLTNNDLVRLDATIFDTLTLQTWHNIFRGRVDPLIWQNSREGFWDRKHYSNPHLYSAWNGNKNAAIMLRLADTYLLLAEAIVQGATDPKGNSATYYVNLVRNRVGLPSLGSVTLADVKNERHLELALEGDRFFDLVRWGDAGSVLVAKPDAGVSSYDDGLPGKNSNGLWPIPDAEIKRVNGSFLQNPGY